MEIVSREKSLENPCEWSCLQSCSQIGRQTWTLKSPQTHFAPPPQKKKCPTLSSFSFLWIGDSCSSFLPFRLITKFGMNLLKTDATYARIFRLFAYSFIVQWFFNRVAKHLKFSRNDQEIIFGISKLLKIYLFQIFNIKMERYLNVF